MWSWRNVGGYPVIGCLIVSSLIFIKPFKSFLFRILKYFTKWRGTFYWIEGQISWQYLIFLLVKWLDKWRKSKFKKVWATGLLAFWLFWIDKLQFRSFCCKADWKLSKLPLCKKGVWTKNSWKTSHVPHFLIKKESA